MKHIVIVIGHPRTGTYCEALGESYARGARAKGHDVRIFVLGKMSFDPVLRSGFERIQPLEPDLQEAHDALLTADHLVVIFPLWMGDMPAILIGYLERILQPDILEPYKQHKFVRLLKGKSVRIIITMAMPDLVYRWWFHAHALKFVRTTLGQIGIKPNRSALFGMVDS